MHHGIVSAAILVLAFAPTPATAAATAADIADFNRAVESAAVHRRATLEYLRGGRHELAARELANLRESWDVVVSRFGNDRPAAFADGDLYTATLVDVSVRLVAASIMLNTGRPDSVRESLSAMRSGLAKLRQSSGVAVFADCVHDASAALRNLQTRATEGTVLSDANTRDALAASADVYGNALERCSGVANAQARRNSELPAALEELRTRLMQVRQAIAARDQEQLRDILAGLRALDSQLIDRFG